MSQEHFKGKYEVELKYRVACPQTFQAKLQLIEHQVMVADNTETDWYFDTPQFMLKAQQKTVSIREMEPSGIKLWIVKGPEADRCEATNITNAIAAKSMLENMGYQVRLITQKIRSIYFIGAFHVTFDYLPEIGHFAEFAIMTDDASALEGYRVQLRDLAAQFGLNDQNLEKHSYLMLFEQHAVKSV